mgnify:CR=1 FL=1|tara:strand:- start:206 stop:319 length:114 start_codon:yes stop_codon:yes gene_type:complete
MFVENDIITDFLSLIGEIMGEWIISQEHAAEISTFLL